MVYIQSIGRQIWPGYLPPFKDEVLSSWLSRIAVAHYTRPHIFAMQYCGMTRSLSGQDIDMHPPEMLIRQILERTPLSATEVEKMLLRSYESSFSEKAFDSTFDIGILKIEKLHKKGYRHGQLFCPDCIVKEPKYLRKHWRLSTSIVCLSCFRQLQDCCQYCMAPLHFYQSGNHVPNLEIPSLGKNGLSCSCGHDFANSNNDLPLTTLELKYQHHIDRILDQGFSAFSQYSFSYIRVLLILTERICRTPSITRSKAMMNRFFSHELPNENRPYSQWKLETRRKILPYGYLLLDKWPKNSEIIRESKILNTLSLNGLPYWFSKEL